MSIQLRLRMGMPRDSPVAPSTARLMEQLEYWTTAPPATVLLEPITPPPNAITLPMTSEPPAPTSKMPLTTTGP